MKTNFIDRILKFCCVQQQEHNAQTNMHVVPNSQGAKTHSADNANLLQTDSRITQNSDM